MEMKTCLQGIIEQYKHTPIVNMNILNCYLVREGLKNLLFCSEWDKIVILHTYVPRGFKQSETDEFEKDKINLWGEGRGKGVGGASEKGDSWGKNTFSSRFWVL